MFRSTTLFCLALASSLLGISSVADADDPVRSEDSRGATNGETLFDFMLTCFEDGLLSEQELAEWSWDEANQYGVGTDVGNGGEMFDFLLTCYESGRVTDGKFVTNLEDRIDDVESQEKLGNMEIQDLMGRYNQSEQLAGNAFKKKEDDDADIDVINKI